jgi:hypothetical protein
LQAGCVGSHRVSAAAGTGSLRFWEMAIPQMGIKTLCRIAFLFQPEPFIYLGLAGCVARRLALSQLRYMIKGATVALVLTVTLSAAFVNLGVACTL